MNYKGMWTLLKDSVSAWIDDYAPSMGAALAYYTMFSLAPLLLIVIAVAGLVFGQDAVRGEIVNQLGGLMGDEGATAVQGLLKSASEPKKGILSSLIGVVLLVVGATTVFAELQSALDRIWRVPAQQKASGLWTLLHTRVLSFGMVLGLGFMLLVSLVVGAGLAALGSWWGGFFGGWEAVLQIVNIAISLGLSAALFAMIYKFMPRAKIAWRDVWIGAAVTAILFEVGKFLIGLYIGKAGVTSGFGAAGSLVVLLVWVYYSALVFLLGAEFTWVYAGAKGSRRASGAPTVASASTRPDQSAKFTASTRKVGDGVRGDGVTIRVPSLETAPLRRSWTLKGPVARFFMAGGTALVVGAVIGKLFTSLPFRSARSGARRPNWSRHFRGAD